MHPRGAHVVIKVILPWRMHLYLFFGGEVASLALRWHSCSWQMCLNSLSKIAMRTTWLGMVSNELDASFRRSAQVSLASIFSCLNVDIVAFKMIEHNMCCQMPFVSGKGERRVPVHPKQGGKEPEEEWLRVCRGHLKPR